MVSTRQIRLVTVTVFFVFLLVVLYKSNDARRTSVASVVSKAQDAADANSLIESTNDDKVDAAINHAISQDKQKQTGGSVGSGSNGAVKGGKAAVGAKPNGAVKPALAAIGDSVPDDKKEDAITNVKLDPSDPNSPTTFDASEEVVQIRSMSPMTIFSKTYCPFSKKLKKLLHDNYQITPEPTIVELDKHAHGEELQAYLEELTGRRTVPNVLVGGSSQSRGGADDFALLHQEGELLSKLTEWGGKKLSVSRIEAPSNV